ncbi:hypothetical protein SIN8267_02746 [Sinobacterium norvegicum]|uniref:Uncharacterized protein n=1 Tax=Sinobacterium norvegicum TaxID=1641715 RepID=A0ABN8EJJ1_9GAMM|nr:hypothetical protein [Sinobacterium norvegicum]CAH0992613.1 hypothetical protein SIN8267_02746 [Sinobacterium norvegicum]
MGQFRVLLSVSLILVWVGVCGCSVIGARADHEINKDKPGDNDYTLSSLGAEVDAAIISYLITPKGEKKVIDNAACTAPGSEQICTATEGCWCQQSE